PSAGSSPAPGSSPTTRRHKRAGSDRLIRMFFSILQRTVIRSGSSTSHQDLLDTLIAFIAS
ncbi:MAG: hypothetical protein ACYDDZ_14765, partial [Acidimicrobiales bacterium]